MKRGPSKKNLILQNLLIKMEVDLSLPILIGFVMTLWENFCIVEHMYGLGMILVHGIVSIEYVK